MEVHSENCLFYNPATEIISFWPMSSKKIGLFSAALESKARTLQMNTQKSRIFFPPMTMYPVPRKL